MGVIDNVPWRSVWDLSPKTINPTGMLSPLLFGLQNSSLAGNQALPVWISQYLLLSSWFSSISPVNTLYPGAKFDSCMQIGFVRIGMVQAWVEKHLKRDILNFFMTSNSVDFHTTFYRSNALYKSSSISKNTSLAPPYKGSITSTKSSWFQWYVTPLCKCYLFCPPHAIPSSKHLKNQAKSQHCNVRLPLSNPHHTSFLIHHQILFAMKSRRFMIDPAKLKKFVNVMLQVPKLRVPETMKLANFSDKDITDLSLRHRWEQSEWQTMQRWATKPLNGSASHTRYKRTRTACPGQLVRGQWRLTRSISIG